MAPAACEWHAWSRLWGIGWSHLAVYDRQQHCVSSIVTTGKARKGQGQQAAQREQAAVAQEIVRQGEAQVDRVKHGFHRGRMKVWRVKSRCGASLQEAYCHPGLVLWMLVTRCGA